MLNIDNQNSILQNNLALQQKLEDRKAFEMFLHKPEHVTCDAPKGHLVKETPIQQFGAMFTDTIQDARNLGNAVMTGKSNDHSLGRMNDLGMKIGGGLIAAALMGKRATTNKKLMEVLGFGTFFSVMSLWPKVAIDLPTKLKHGFNPHQKYIDSQGRKKQFFQDNQYLPWDVWTKEDINKVADKMNVPKDIEDREEYTKEKMRTIALQDNTLWMLTAGFATPLLTSLACNRIEEGMRNPVAKMNLKGIQKNIANGAKQVDKLIQNPAVFEAQNKAFNGVIEELRAGRMPENIVETISEIFDVTNVSDNGIKGVLPKAGAKDLLDRIFTKSGFVFEDSTLLKHIAEGADEAEALKALQETQARLVARGETPSLRAIVNELRAERGAIFSLEGQPSWLKKLASIPEKDMGKFAEEAAGYSAETLSEGADILTDIYTKGVRPAQAQMKLMGKNVAALNNVSGEKYNKAVRGIIKALNLSDKEIKAIQHSSESSDVIQEIITKKLSEIAGDSAKTDKFLKTLDKQIESIDTNGAEASANGIISKTFGKIAASTKRFFKRTGKNLSDGSKEKLKGTELGKRFLAGTTEKGFADYSNVGLTKLEAIIVKNNIRSVNSTLTGVRNALELEKRIANGSFLEEWKQIATRNGVSLDSIGGKDALYAQARKLAWQSSYGDMMNKGYMEGNGGLFKTMVESVFGGNSENADVNSWCKGVRKLLFGENYIPNPALQEGGAEIAQNSVKFANFGENFLSAAKKQANQLYNDRKWMKTFGGITAALVGVTLISQLFFGKVKDAHLYKKAQNTQDTFESGK